jgi:hypothetical protein
MGMLSGNTSTEDRYPLDRRIGNDIRTRPVLTVTDGAPLMYCIGASTYTDVAKRIEASLPAQADDDQHIRERLRVLERNYAIHIIVVYEQVFYQWKYTPWYQKRRRRFLRDMKDYFTGRVLQNPRILAYISSDPSGCSLHLEGESMEHLLQQIGSAIAIPKADYTGPFGPELRSAAVLPGMKRGGTLFRLLRALHLG